MKSHVAAIRLGAPSLDSAYNEGHNVSLWGQTFCNHNNWQKMTLRFLFCTKANDNQTLKQ